MTAPVRELHLSGHLTAPVRELHLSGHLEWPEVSSSFPQELDNDSSRQGAASFYLYKL